MMLRFRCWGLRLGSMFTWAAAWSSLGCMDDTVVVRRGVEEPSSAGMSPGDDTGASDGSSSDPGAPGSTPLDGSTGAAPGTSSSAQTSPGSVAVPLGEPPAEDCWQLPVVDRARLLAPNGLGSALVGGKLVGSSTSPTNGFVDLAVIAAAPSDGEWLEVQIESTEPFRYVKYYGPGGSYGALAELELYAREQRVQGAGFGSAGSRDEGGNVFANALDGDPSTWFEGPLPNDNYVGLDLGDGHELPAPTVAPAGGAAAVGDPITLSAGPDVSIWYTTDGSDPASNGQPYTDPIPLTSGSTLLKAIAVGHCALPSPVTQSVFTTATAGGGAGGTPGVQSSMHIGNSLTDTINDILPTLAADGGIALDYNRYTIPGAGTWLYDQNPTGGFGVADVQETLRTRPFDHLSMQPFPNLPCQPVPSADGNDSDSGYLAQAWADARTQNPDVQLWVYQQWPAPADPVNCFTGGGWTRGDWQPDAPTSWEDGVATELTYQEAVRSALVAQQPDAPTPFIVPGGLALVALKQAIEAGQVPGFSDFFGSLFQAGGEDIHLTSAGAYYISLVFYGCMFQQDPAGVGNDSGGVLTDEQAVVFQRIAWETVVSYPLSGVNR